MSRQERFEDFYNGNDDNYSWDYLSAANQQEAANAIDWAREKVQAASDNPDEDPIGFGRVVRNVAEIPRGVGTGVIDGLNEAVATIYQLGDALGPYLPEFMNWRPELRYDEDGGFAGVGINKTQHDSANPSAPPALPNFDAPETGLGQFTNEVSQFLTGFAGAGKVLKPIQGAGKAGRLGKAMVQGGIADFAFMNPFEARVSDFIQAVPELENPVNEFLASSPDDTALDGRLKNAVEGLGLGAAADGVMAAFKAVRGARWFRNKFPTAGEAGRNLVADLEGTYAEREAGDFLRNLGDLNAPLIREASPEEVLSQPARQAGITQHEKGVTGLSKSNQKIMDSADWQAAKSNDSVAATRVVDQIWGDKQTKELASKLDPSKETVFVSVPSTSGVNRLPDALGEKLARELGGEFVPSAGIKGKTRREMKLVSRDERPFAAREYVLDNPELIENIKGKQVVVTEDVFTTGSSARQFVLALRGQGVDVHSVAGLMGNARLDAPPQLVSRLQKTLKNAGMDIKGKELADVLSGGEIDTIIDVINRAGGADARNEIAGKLRGLLDQRSAGSVEGHSQRHGQGQPGVYGRNGAGDARLTDGTPPDREGLEPGSGTGARGHSAGQESSEALRDRPGPVGGQRGEQAGAGGQVENAKADSLERSGFAVDRNVINAPIAPDGKRRYAITREALEAEGELGERWTRIETNVEDWPELPAERGRKGQWVKDWREFGKGLYNKIRGQRHTVKSSGDTIVLGTEGRTHMLGQNQTPEGIKAIPHLPELIQKSFKIAEYNPKVSQAKKPDMRPVTVYHSAAAIDGKPYDVQLVAKRNASGEQELMFYDLRAAGKGTDRPTEPWLPKGNEPHRPPQVENLSAGKRIISGAADVNAQAADLSSTRVADFFSDVKDVVDGASLNNADGGGYSRGAGELSVNFARIDSPEDIKSVMQNMASRGRRSFKEIELSAGQEDAWKLLAGRRQGGPLNAEQSLAARHLWASSTEKLASLARAAQENPSNENLFAFRKMLAIQDAIQKEVIAARTETARALSAWHINAGSHDQMAEQMSSLLDAFGGTEVNRELAARVAMLSQRGMVTELGELAGKSMYARSRDAVQEAWVMALLSSPKTHLVNMMGNTFTAFQQVFERGAAARLGRALGDETGVRIGEASAMLTGMIGGLKDGLRLAGKAFKMDQGGAWANKVELRPTPSIASEHFNLAKDGLMGKAVDVIGRVVRAPGRALTAEDEFFKSVGYRAELHAQAFREATREAAAGQIPKDQVKARMAELVDNPPRNIHLAAIDNAAYATFTNAPGQFAQGWMRLAQQNPSLRFITPFIKTPANILNYALAERSPLAPLFRGFREDVAAGGARQQLALARASTGTATMMIAADLAFSGTITGDGPASPAERQTLMRTGWQPNSIKIGDRYYSYSRTDPVGLTLGIAANLAEISNHMDQEDREVDADEAAIHFAASIAGAVMSRNYMRGLSDFMEMLAEPQGRAESCFNRLADGFVPAIVGEAARQVDPYMLEVNSMVDAMRARIPGLSKELPARRGLWGRAITYRSGLGAFYDAISPIAGRRENPEPIDQEMLQQECHVAAPKKTVSFDGVNVDLTRWEGAYSRYVELAGNEARNPAWQKGCMDFLNQVVSGGHPLSALYKMKSDGPEGGKADFIRATVMEYRKLARQQLLKEYPEIRQHIGGKRVGPMSKWNIQGAGNKMPAIGQ